MDFKFDHIPGHRENEVFICCPFCNSRGFDRDTRYKMGVNLQSGMYNCFICEARPSVTGSLNKVKQLSFLNVQIGETEQLDSLKNNIINMLKKPEEFRIDLDQISWPLSSETPIAYKYVKDRGISDEEISRYGLRVGRDYVCPEKKYTVQKWSGRVIFPFYEKSRVSYVVGRSYTGKDPKYLNSKGKKGFLVWGLDSVQEGVAILCEGIISAIAAHRVTGVSTICTLGKTLSQWQVSKIGTKCHTIIKSFDGGLSREENDRITSQLVSSGIRVYDILLPTIIKCSYCSKVNEVVYKVKRCPECDSLDISVGGPDPDELKGEYLKFFNSRKKVSLVGSFSHI